MTRFLRIALAVVTLLGAGLLLWRAVYRPAPLPASVRLAGLESDVSIGWHANDAVSIRAGTSADAWAALGYAHGMQRAWPVSLWRQTALGRLAEWFGPQVLPLDRHARRLGLARHARTSYARLPNAEQRVLQAYVRGLNAALATERAQQDDALVLLDVRPPAWKPWHPLAVERLFAWLSTERLVLPPRASETAGAQAAIDFVRTDARFRRWLHLHGFERSFLWTGAAATADTTRAPFVARFVTGASALPVFQEATVERAGQTHMLTTVPGSPLVLAGAGAGSAWGWLPHSPARLVRTSDTTWTQWRDRLQTASGAETLVTVYRGRAQLPFAPTADTTWALAWSGLAPGTDAPHWHRLGPPPDTLAFQLFSGYGLATAPDGTARTYGTPPVAVQRLYSERFVGTSPWATWQVRALPLLPERAAASPAAWTMQDSSAWAGALLPNRLSALAPLADSTASETFHNAYTYLRNWNLRFGASSIGASIFERWMQHYSRILGAPPAVSDTSFFADHRLRLAFGRAVQDVQRTQGPDLRQWRWERVLPGECLFPVWSADSLVAGDLSGMATTHFAPVPCRRGGHPSALAGGPSRFAPTWPAPSPVGWTGWTNPSRRTLSVRRLRFSPSGFLARSLSAPARPDAQRLDRASPERITRLRPDAAPVP